MPLSVTGSQGISSLDPLFSVSDRKELGTCLWNWSLYHNCLLVQAHRGLCGLYVQASNSFFEVEENQSDGTGLLSVTLPMHGPWKVRVLNSFLKHATSKLDVFVASSVGPGSFVECTTRGARDSLQSCVFSRVGLSRDSVSFVCQRCRMIRALNISSSFMSFRQVRVEVVRHKLGQRAKFSTALYAELEWIGVFYHYQAETMLPLFSLLRIHRQLPVSKVLCLSRRRVGLSDQLRCLGFTGTAEIQPEWMYKKVIVGFPQLYSTPGPLRDGSCKQGFMDELAEWRAWHHRCFAGSNVSRPRQRFTLVVLNRPKTYPRRVSNPKRLVTHLRASLPGNWDLVYTELEGCDFRCQVNLFAGADILVAVHGSGLFHVTFMRPGSVVLELSPYLFPSFCTYRYLSVCAGLRHFQFEAFRGSSVPARGNRQRIRDVESDYSLMYIMPASPWRGAVRDQTLCLSEAEMSYLSWVVGRYASGFSSECGPAAPDPQVKRSLVELLVGT